MTVMGRPPKYFSAQERREADLERSRTWYQRKSRSTSARSFPRALDIPDCVLAERDAALASPRNLTAQICGDPAAGRSALDQKNGRNP